MKRTGNGAYSFGSIPVQSRCKSAAIAKAYSPTQIACPKCGKNPNRIKQDGKFAVYVHEAKAAGNTECRAEIWAQPRIKLNIPGYE